MHKKLILFAFCLFGFVSLQAQLQLDTNQPPKGVAATPAAQFDYGNQWYDAAQPWVKLEVWEDGIYRVTAADLVTAGVSVAGIDPDYFHIFYRGEEQAIHVVETSGQLDYLEFYGLRNDGRVDSMMYRNPDPIYGKGLHAPEMGPNKRISIFSDTSAYFLTWNTTPGRRVATYYNNNYSSFTPEPHFRYEAYKEYHPSTNGAFNLGGGTKYDPYYNLNCDYITGEGYMHSVNFSNSPSGGTSRVFSLQTPYAVNSGPHELTARVYGRSTQMHIVEVRVETTNQSSVQTVVYDTTSGVNIKTHKLPFQWTLPSTTRMRFFAHGTQNNFTDNNTICWGAIKYDREFKMSNWNSIMVHDWNKAQDALFAFDNVDISSEGWFWDTRNWVRIQGEMRGTDSLWAIIPGANNERDIYVATDNSIRTPQINPSPALSNLSDPGSGAEFIIITNRNLASSAIAYKNYRDTCTVNQLSTKIVFVDQIYEEFGYGSITPWAIKRFCKYAMDNYSPAPKYFMLWGKGQYLTRDHPKNLVPTYGYPACDAEFVSNFDPEEINLIPETPIGRVNIQTNAEGLTYLDKVNEYEHTPWAPWMKEMVLMGGGEDTLEQRPILNYLTNYRTTFEGVPNGGRAWYFQKYNGQIRTNSTLTSTDHINSGVSVIHFFGHSSSNIFDIDIQLPSLYTNDGRYPVMVAFGCYGGDFTKDDKSFGEKFVLEPGKGAIGYFANSTAGYLNPLGQYGEHFYPSAFRDHAGEGIGDIVQGAIHDYASLFTDQLHNNHTKQLNYQGDPSVSLYYTPFPDYEITPASVFLSPTNVSAADDSFEVKIVTKNLGLVTQDSFWVSIRQEVPSGGIITHPMVKHPPIAFQDTITYKIYNNQGNSIAGINRFDVFVDSTDIVTEGDESNNRVTYETVIPGDVPAILHPFEYAVIDTPSTYLAASAYIISQQPSVNYIFEIDTVPEFHSPRHTTSGAFSASSNYARWDIPFQLEPNQVYYWRVRLADIYPIAWATSSFKYIPGKEGWGQSEPPQFFKDPTSQILMNELVREWEFEKTQEVLSIFNIQGTNQMMFRLQGYRSKEPSDYANRDGVHYSIIDGNTLTPKVTGSIIGDWVYAPTPVNVQQLVRDIQTAETGDYVLICSVNDHNMQNWPPNAIQTFYDIGCSNNILSLNGNDMFAILGRKGFPGSAVEVLGPNVTVTNGTGGTDDIFDVNVVLEGNLGLGDIQSTLIGPAVEWDELIWEWDTQDPFPNETQTVDVYAVRNNNTDSLILEDIDQGTYSLSMIDQQQFPYLRLQSHAEDQESYTAPQLKNWYVLFTPAPEAVVDPVTHFVFNSDTVDEGQDVSLSIASVNVSDSDMDSLLVKYSVVREDRSTVELGTQRYAPLPGQDQMNVDYSFNTAFRDIAGNVSMMVEINPDGDQPEQYHFNNLYTYDFFVREDEVNPILDVTFDGKHIMDWDIVSPNPEILIEINDENPYLKVNDTAFTLYFGQDGLGNNLELIHLQGNVDIERIPATLPDNKAQIYYRPKNLPDGDYTLKVMGYDHKGNESGEVEYEIHFKVVNESSVSNILNYPNPFSTSTEFVYTLTGSQIPDEFRIDIYTITGILVKTIDLAEMGQVKIGYTRTDYKWDGRDEYGDLLANGVYVYKVTVKSGGIPLKIRDEGLSPYFKNGIGKLYIMR